MPDADAVTESMDEDGALAAMEQGAVWLQLATVGVAAAARAAHEKSSSAVELGHGDADMAATYFATAPARTFTEP